MIYDFLKLITYVPTGYCQEVIRKDKTTKPSSTHVHANMFTCKYSHKNSYVCI